MERSMKTNASKLSYEDKALTVAKREQQASARALVESGARSQESMFFISPTVVKAAIVRHRVLSF